MQVSVNEVTKRFVSKHETVVALDRVTTTSPAQKILTLLGPSGCGKTTLLRCIAGLEVPDAGELMIGDRTVWSKARGISVPPEGRGLGMVFQSYAIWPHMTVFENLAYPLKIRKYGREDMRDRVAKALSLVQLEGFENRPATKLSGGQQQRVALARALVAEPKVILLDEPLSNLDAKLRESTRKELRTFLSELAISAIYVTHDQVEALTISDEVSVMRSGVIVERGSPEAMYFNSDDPFVVEFIGRANFLEATITGYRTPDQAVVSCPLGTLVCTAPPDLPPGSQVTLYARPEAFEVLPSDAPAEENTFEGTINTRLFAGESYEAEIDVGEARLVAKFDLTVSLKEGELVRLRLGPQWCRVLNPKDRT